MTAEEKSMALYMIDLLCEANAEGERMRLVDDAIFRKRGDLSKAGPAHFAVSDGEKTFRIEVREYPAIFDEV
ncbi:MAG: hypothetical protein DWQ35_00415 [Planctomycetota bacterium]|nr:MAG: hypothetical protein DWQ35_00415 [Planctomycetota bacterium]